VTGMCRLLAEDRGTRTEINSCTGGGDRQSHLTRIEFLVLNDHATVSAPSREFEARAADGVEVMCGSFRRAYAEDAEDDRAKGCRLDFKAVSHWDLIGS